MRCTMCRTVASALNTNQLSGFCPASLMAIFCRRVGFLPFFTGILLCCKSVYCCFCTFEIKRGDAMNGEGGNPLNLEYFSDLNLCCSKHWNLKHKRLPFLHPLFTPERRIFGMGCRRSSRDVSVHSGLRSHHGTYF